MGVRELWGLSRLLVADRCLLGELVAGDVTKSLALSLSALSPRLWIWGLPLLGWVGRALRPLVAPRAFCAPPWRQDVMVSMELGPVW